MIADERGREGKKERRVCFYLLYFAATFDHLADIVLDKCPADICVTHQQAFPKLLDRVLEQ